MLWCQAVPFNYRTPFNWSSKSSQDSRRFKFKYEGQIVPWSHSSSIFPTFIWKQCLVCQSILCLTIFCWIHTTFTFSFLIYPVPLNFKDVTKNSDDCCNDLLMMYDTYIFCETMFKNWRTVLSEVTEITPNLLWILLFQCLFLMFVILISELVQWPVQILESSMMNFWSRTSGNNSTLILQCVLSDLHNFFALIGKVSFISWNSSQPLCTWLLPTSGSF